MRGGVGIALALAALVTLPLVGCTALPGEPHNPIRIEQPWGIATGKTEAETRSLVDLVNESRALLGRLETFEERPLRIHWADRLPESTSGLNATGPFGLHYVLIERGQEDALETVAHELVHHYLGDAFDGLPAVLEEGICVVLAAEAIGSQATLENRVLMAAVNYLQNYDLKIRGAGGREMLLFVLQDVPSFEVVLGLSKRELFSSDPQEKIVYYGVGATLVAAIGVERLFAVVERERELDPQRILELAGLVPLTQESLLRVFAGALGYAVDSDDAALTITISGEGSDS